MPGLRRLKPKHEAIMDWILTNPERPLRDAAEAFGVSQNWISFLVNSDLFSARLRERRAQIEGLIGHTIVDRLKVVAHMGLGSMIDRMERGVASERMIVDATRMALQSLGYTTPQQPEPQRHIHLHVSADELREARERAAAAASAALKGGDGVDAIPVDEGVDQPVCD